MIEHEACLPLTPIAVLSTRCNVRSTELEHLQLNERAYTGPAIDSKVVAALLAFVITLIIGSKQYTLYQKVYTLPL